MPARTPEQRRRIIVRKGDEWRINGAIVSADRTVKLTVEGEAERIERACREHEGAA